ncbi:MAG: hypothetical protein KY469_22725 [Actinobacteria bacterium]|nr:hypothetical protein [Actinomycetota bacterium]
MDAKIITDGMPTQLPDADPQETREWLDSLQAVVDQVIADNPDTVEDIRGGNDKAIGALVGQVMRATRGKANPQLANELIAETIRGS